MTPSAPLHLQLWTRADALPDEPARAARERLADAVALPGDAAGKVPEGLARLSLVDARAVATGRGCRDALGASAREGGLELACPHDEAARAELEDRVRVAARAPVDGVLLERPDAWYDAGPRGAGFCGACAARLARALRAGYGEQLLPFEALPGIAAAPARQGPFWREHEAVRLSSGAEWGARLARRARDEARLRRGREILVGALLESASPAAVLLAKRLDFAVIRVPAPRPDRCRLASWEIFRAALGPRPLAGRLDDEAAVRPGAVRQAARLAAAVGAALTLPDGAPAASHEALAAHRRFWRELGPRHRGLPQLAEALLLYSPACDHWSAGRHGAGVRATAEALTALAVQYRIVLETPDAGSEPLVLADAAALPEDEAARVQRRVAGGASALVVGPCGAADGEGRGLPGPFAELRDGLQRAGQGTLFGVDVHPPPEPEGAAERLWEALREPLDRALGALMGRGRRAAAVTNAELTVKLHLDPDRRLVAHLVGRALDPQTGEALPVRDAALHLGGPAAGGSRSATLHLPDGSERKVPLTPYGMGVRAELPDLPGAAVLVVPR